ncbi:hypothetical protein [Gorillibacterium sp. sgz5001074]
MGVLKVWGTDHIGPWEEKVECESWEVGGWLEYYKEGMEGHDYHGDDESY